ncbi:MAG: DUF92 domain-containing protein [Thermoplasmatota archaeon]
MDIYLPALKIGICVLFAAVSTRFRFLDYGGTVAATVIGLVIIFAGGIAWFAILLLFLLLGIIATKYRYRYKERKGLHERGNGMRKARNVLANGMLPAVTALLAPVFSRGEMAVPFAAAIAVATADTFASELGVLSEKVYLITTLRRTDVGTNGGVSWLGEGAALLGSLAIAVPSVFLLGIGLVWLPFIAAVGFLGCQVDSLLGATLQGGEIGTEEQLPSDAVLTNSDVNLLSIAVAVLIAFVYAVLLF